MSGRAAQGAEASDADNAAELEEARLGEIVLEK